MQGETSGQYFLPSETCRLVLGFLKDGNYMKTYNCFLKECVHLREYDSLLKRGQEYPTTIMGLSLVMMLNEYALHKVSMLGGSTPSQLPAPVTPKNFSSPSQTKSQVELRKLDQSSRTKALMRQRQGLPSACLSQSRCEWIHNSQVVPGTPGVCAGQTVQSTHQSSEHQAVEAVVDPQRNTNASIVMLSWGDRSVPCSQSTRSSQLRVSGSAADATNATVSACSGNQWFENDQPGQPNQKRSDKSVPVSHSSSAQKPFSHQQNSADTSGSGFPDDSDQARCELRSGDTDSALGPDLNNSSSTSTSTGVTLVPRKPHQTSTTISSTRQSCLPSTADGMSVPSQTLNATTKCDEQSSKQALGKRRKKPPRRRSDVHIDSTAGAGNENPLNKMINSSRFVKTLVDNINTCLYDTQKHQGASSVLAEKAVTQPAGKGQPQCNASNHMPHEDSSLEEFDFLNKDMSNDTVSNIITLTSNDPIFDELLEIFNQDTQPSGVHEGLHTPPPSAPDTENPMTDYAAPLTLPSTLSAPSSGSLPAGTLSSSCMRPATLSFSTECIDLNSMSGFPNLSDLSEEQGALPLSRHSSQETASSTRPDSSVQESDILTDVKTVADSEKVILQKECESSQSAVHEQQEGLHQSGQTAVSTALSEQQISPCESAENRADSSEVDTAQRLSSISSQASAGVVMDVLNEDDNTNHLKDKPDVFLQGESKETFVVPVKICDSHSASPRSCTTESSHAPKITESPQSQIHGDANSTQTCVDLASSGKQMLPLPLNSDSVENTMQSSSVNCESAQLATVVPLSVSSECVHTSDFPEHPVSSAATSVSTSSVQLIPYCSSASSSSERENTVVTASAESVVVSCSCSADGSESSARQKTVGSEFSDLEKSALPEQEGATPGHLNRSDDDQVTETSVHIEHNYSHTDSQTGRFTSTWEETSQSTSLSTCPATPVSLNSELISLRSKLALSETVEESGSENICFDGTRHGAVVIRDDCSFVAEPQSALRTELEADRDVSGSKEQAEEISTEKMETEDDETDCIEPESVLSRENVSHSVESTTARLEVSDSNATVGTLSSVESVMLLGTKLHQVVGSKASKTESDQSSQNTGLTTSELGLSLKMTGSTDSSQSLPQVLASPSQSGEPASEESQKSQPAPAVTHPFPEKEGHRQGQSLCVSSTSVSQPATIFVQAEPSSSGFGGCCVLSLASLAKAVIFSTRSGSPSCVIPELSDFAEGIPVNRKQTHVLCPPSLAVSQHLTHTVPHKSFPLSHSSITSVSRSSTSTLSQLSTPALTWHSVSTGSSESVSTQQTTPTLSQDTKSDGRPAFAVYEGAAPAQGSDDPLSQGPPPPQLSDSGRHQQQCLATSVHPKSFAVDSLLPAGSSVRSPCSPGVHRSPGRFKTYDLSQSSPKKSHPLLREALLGGKSHHSSPAAGPSEEKPPYFRSRTLSDPRPLLARSSARVWRSRSGSRQQVWRSRSGSRQQSAKLHTSLTEPVPADNNQGTTAVLLLRKALAHMGKKPSRFKDLQLCVDALSDSLHPSDSSSVVQQDQESLPSTACVKSSLDKNDKGVKDLGQVLSKNLNLKNKHADIAEVHKGHDNIPESSAKKQRSSGVFSISVAVEKSAYSVSNNENEKLPEPCTLPKSPHRHAQPSAEDAQTETDLSEPKTSSINENSSEHSETVERNINEIPRHLVRVVADQIHDPVSVLKVAESSQSPVFPVAKTSEPVKDMLNIAQSTQPVTLQQILSDVENNSSFNGESVEDSTGVREDALDSSQHSLPGKNGEIQTDLKVGQTATESLSYAVISDPRDSFDRRFEANKEGMAKTLFSDSMAVSEQCTPIQSCASVFSSGGPTSPCIASLSSASTPQQVPSQTPSSAIVTTFKQSTSNTCQQVPSLMAQPANSPLLSLAPPPVPQSPQLASASTAVTPQPQTPPQASAVTPQRVPPHTPPRSRTHKSGRSSAITPRRLSPRARPQSSSSTHQRSPPRTPQRPISSTSYSRCDFTPPYADRRTPTYSPIKSPYSPGTGATITSLFSPRRKRLLNEPIPEEVLDELSRNSDSCFSDIQSVSRPVSACADVEGMDEDGDCNQDLSKDVPRGLSPHGQLSSKQNLRDVDQLALSCQTHADSGDTNITQLSNSSHQTASSSGMKNFRVVGTIELQVSPPVQQPENQQRGRLISVGDNLPAQDESSRHSATICSTHVTYQQASKTQEKDSTVGKETQSCAAVSRPEADVEESCAGITFISPGIDDEACRTSISMPILPLDVTQFLDSQMQTGNLEVPLDFTGDLPQQKTPTTSPAKVTARKSTPRKSPRKPSTLQQFSMCIGQFASLSRRKAKHVRKTTPRKTTPRKTTPRKTTPRKTTPRKSKSSLKRNRTRQEQRKVVLQKLDTRTTRAHTFASVSHKGASEQVSSGLNSKTRSDLDSHGSAADRPAMKLTESSSTKSHQKNQPPSKQVQKLAAEKAALSTVQTQSTRDDISDTDSFSIHSCSSSEEGDSSSGDSQPVSELVKKKTSESNCPLNSSSSLVSARSLQQEQQWTKLQLCEEQHESAQGVEKNHESRGAVGLPQNVISEDPSVSVVNWHLDAETGTHPSVRAEKANLPFKKRVFERKDLCVVNPDSSFSRKKPPVPRKNLQLLLSDQPGKKERKVPLTESDPEDPYEKESSKLSASGSSSVEVDVCALSEMEDSDNEVVPSSQCERKKRAIIAAKRSAKKRLSQMKKSSCVKRKTSLAAGTTTKKNSKESKTSSHATDLSSSRSAASVGMQHVATSSEREVSHASVGNRSPKKRPVSLQKSPKKPLSVAKKPSASAAPTPSESSSALEPEQHRLTRSSKPATRPGVGTSSSVHQSVTDSHGAGVTGSGGQQAKETGSGTTQQSQPFSYTALRQPEAVGIQTYGPYRRITPTLISKTTSSYFPPARSRMGTRQQALTTDSAASPSVFSIFSAPSPTTLPQEMSLEAVATPTLGIFSPGLQSPQLLASVAVSKDGCASFFPSSATSTPSPVASTQKAALRSASVKQSSCEEHSPTKQSSGKAPSERGGVAGKQAVHPLQKSTRSSDDSNGRGEKVREKDTKKKNASKVTRSHQPVSPVTSAKKSSKTTVEVEAEMEISIPQASDSFGTENVVRTLSELQPSDHHQYGHGDADHVSCGTKGTKAGKRRKPSGAGHSQASPMCEVGGSRNSRKRKNTTSPVNKSVKKGRKEAALQDQPTLHDGTGTCFKTPTRKAQTKANMRSVPSGTDTRKDSSGPESDIHSMPFLGEISRNSCTLTLTEINSSSQGALKVINIQEAELNSTTEKETSKKSGLCEKSGGGGASASECVDGGSIVSRFSSLLDELESADRGDGGGVVSLTPDKVLSGVKTSSQYCVNRSDQQTLDGHQMLQESMVFGQNQLQHGRETLGATQCETNMPDRQTQEPEEGKAREAVFTLRQAEKQGVSVGTHTPGNGSSRQMKNLPAVHTSFAPVLSQIIFSPLKGVPFRQILPKGSESKTITNADSTVTQSAPVNALDAAMIAVLPELAASPHSGTQTPTNSPKQNTKKTDKKGQNKETVVCNRHKKTTRKEKPKHTKPKKGKQALVARALPDLASPIPLIIDDTVQLSGDEASPLVKGNTAEERQSKEKQNLKKGRKSSGAAAKKLTRKLEKVFNKEVSSSDATHTAESVLRRTVDCSVQQSLPKPSQQPAQGSAQELFKRMLDPPVPCAVPVPESDNEVSLPAHDTLTVLMPLSWSPLKPSTPAVVKVSEPLSHASVSLTPVQNSLAHQGVSLNSSQLTTPSVQLPVKRLESNSFQPSPSEPLQQASVSTRPQTFRLTTLAESAPSTSVAQGQVSVIPQLASVSSHAPVSARTNLSATRPTKSGIQKPTARGRARASAPQGPASPVDLQPKTDSVSTLAATYQHSVLLTSSGSESPRLQAAKTLASIAVIGAERGAEAAATEEMKDVRPEGEAVKSNPTHKVHTTKLKRLSGINIDKFLRKKVHKN